MNDFRNTPRRAQRPAIDGVLNAPTRPQLTSRPLGRKRLAGDQLRTSQRTIGDFKQGEGYHAAEKSAIHAARTAAPSMPLSLPGENAEGKQKKRRFGLFSRKSQKNIPSKPVSKRRKIIKRILWSLAALVLIFVLVGGFLFAKGYIKLHKVFKGGAPSAVGLKKDVQPSLLKGEGDGRVNILLLGRGGDGHDGPDLTDTILLASVDPVNKKAALVSVPRDLWVTAPGLGSMKINAVYANAKGAALAKNAKDIKAAEAAGIDKVEQVVSSTLGVSIHYYGIVDFQAFKQAVNTVGGVTINVPEDLVDSTMAWQNRGSAVLARKGVQTFDGDRALMYVRSRHGSARGDFDRTERQRLFIQALSQKILSAGTYTNPLKISQLLDTFGNHVATDLSVTDALRLMDIAKQMNGVFTSIGLSDPPNNFVTTGMVNGQSIVRPIAGITNFGDIQAYIRTALRDGYLAKEDAEVMVLNGSGTAGLAANKANVLKSYGYKVGTVGEAPTATYAQTVIVDMSDGKNPYTKNYLEKRYGVKVVTKLPDTAITPGSAQFVVILGKNETINR